jgi:Tol biopolymer transport system component
MRASHIAGALLTVAGFLYSQQNPNGFPKLTGPYLGQKPPGATPEAFAPGIVSFGYHEHRLAVSPDGKEILFTIFSTNPSRAMIMCTHLKNGTWTTPAVAPFSNSGMDLHPAFSPDGKRLYFTSTRPLLKDGKRTNGADIWCVDRQGDSWSEPVNVGAAINTEDNESSPSVMSDGTLFFESNREGNKKDWNIYFSRQANGVYQKVERLPMPVNTENEEGGPFIAPDGSYLLFHSNRPGTFGEADIYITFRNEYGTWNEPVNLDGKINSKFYDWSPSITSEGKYLVFSSYRNTETVVAEYGQYSETVRKSFGQPKIGFGTLYWVDASFVEELRNKSLQGEKGM